MMLSLLTILTGMSRIPSAILTFHHPHIFNAFDSHSSGLGRVIGAAPLTSLVATTTIATTMTTATTSATTFTSCLSLQTSLTSFLALLFVTRERALGGYVRAITIITGGRNSIH
jgi:hypothetical protein